MAQPQPVIKRRDHRFQPRELPTIPALKVFAAGFHEAIRAPHQKNRKLWRKFRRLSDIGSARALGAKIFIGLPTPYLLARRRAARLTAAFARRSWIGAAFPADAAREAAPHAV